MVLANRFGLGLCRCSVRAARRRRLFIGGGSRAGRHYETTIPLFHYALWIAYLGEAYLLAGRRDDAVQLAGRALELCCERKEPGHQAWTLRLLGEIYAHHDPPEVERAEDVYQQAMTLAVELGMGPLQAHCHLGLGMLSARLSRREQARTELSAAIEL